MPQALSATHGEQEDKDGRDAELFTIHHHKTNIFYCHFNYVLLGYPSSTTPSYIKATHFIIIFEAL
jgi:hypothetical protein